MKDRNPSKCGTVEGVRVLCSVSVCVSASMCKTEVKSKQSLIKLCYLIMVRSCLQNHVHTLKPIVFNIQDLYLLEGIKIYLLMFIFSVKKLHHRN